MALPLGAVGWTAVCYCGISRSYSLTFLLITEQKHPFSLAPFFKCDNELTHKKMVITIIHVLKI